MCVVVVAGEKTGEEKGEGWSLFDKHRRLFAEWMKVIRQTEEGRSSNGGSSFDKQKKRKCTKKMWLIF